MPYTFIVKMSLNSKILNFSPLVNTFPKGSDALLTSVQFQEYRKCVAACKELMDSKAIELTKNAGITGKFDVAWESNPFIDGRISDMTDTERALHEKIWEKDEVMKMFAINPNLKDTDNNKLFAVVSGSIMTQPGKNTVPIEALMLN